MVMDRQSSSMSRIPARCRRGRERWRNEQGFTLIEVIVSIALVLVAGLAAAQFTITAIHTSHAQQQRAAAVSIANGSLEQAEALLGSNKPQDYAKTLVKGVKESESKAAWKAVSDLGAVSADDMDLFYQLESTSDTGGVTVKRMAKPEESRSGTFTVYTMLGKCYRKQGTAACKSANALGLPTGGLQSGSTDVSSQVWSNADMPTAPFKNSADAHTYIPMLRVMVAVTWPDVGGSAKTCVYATSRLIDPNEDKAI